MNELQRNFLHLCKSFFQSGCQLVGAGGGLHTTVDALNSGDNLLNVHSLYQSTDTLEVAVAATEKLNIFQLALLNLKENALRAGALGLVFVLLDSLPFC